MARLAYVNGRYLPPSRAHIAIEDRAVQFSDGVYEVALALNGRLLDLDRHLARLRRSLAELQIGWPVSEAVLRQILDRLVRLNRLPDALVYWQISRGVAPRDHAFPVPAPKPSLVVTMRRLDLAAVAQRQRDGIAIATAPDLRWGRCDIKSVSLLGNVLAKQAARQAGAVEAWMVDRDGLITEGASTTAFLVKDGQIVTRRAGPDILPGITRDVISGLTALDLVERGFSAEEAAKADEAFLTSATSFVTPVVAIDGQRIGTGRPGPATRALIAAHWDHVTAQTGRVRPDPAP